MLKKLLDTENVGSIAYDVKLSTISTIHIGGNANAVITPTMLPQLQNLLRLAKKNNIDWLVVGNASNMLFSDNGFRGIIIKLTQPFFPTKIDGENVVVSCFSSARQLALKTFESNLSGLEHFFLIPATVGGAIAMNASCFGYSTDTTLQSVTVLDENGEIETLTKEQLHLSYRHSIFQDKPLIAVAANFRLETATKTNPLSEAKLLLKEKKVKQPLDKPSLGSVFRSISSNTSAAKLIDEAGLKGFCIGGAEISQKHSGFIINNGGATCNDVLLLIHHIKQQIFNKYGILLKEEIKIVSEKLK